MIALNSLSGFASPRVACSSKLGVISSRVWREVREMHVKNKLVDTGETAKEARRVLLGASAAMYDIAAPQEQPFSQDKVAWPDVGGNKPLLAEHLPRHLADMVEGLDRRWVKEDDQYNKLVQEVGRPKLHGCPALKKGRREYKTFVADGVQRGVFRLGLRCVEKVKIFFVGKKCGGLRLIVDCRRSNQRFGVPPHTSLFSGAGFVEVHMDAGARLYLAAVDVKTAFYQWRLPPWLSELFCLDGVPAGLFGVSEVDGVQVHPNRMVYPQMAVVPPGWTWGLALVQAVHENLLDADVLCGKHAALSTSNHLHARVRALSTACTLTTSALQARVRQM